MIAYLDTLNQLLDDLEAGQRIDPDQIIAAREDLEDLSAELAALPKLELGSKSGINHPENLTAQDEDINEDDPLAGTWAEGLTAGSGVTMTGILGHAVARGAPDRIQKRIKRVISRVSAAGAGGRGNLDLKMINGHHYLYWRWRDGTKQRSQYICPAKTK